MACQHQAKILHAARTFCAAQCELCGRPWAGNPSRPNAPRWVVAANEKAVARILARTKRTAKEPKP